MRLSLIAATIAIVISVTSVQEVSAHKKGRFNRRKVQDSMLRKRVAPATQGLPQGYSVCPDLDWPKNPACAQPQVPPAAAKPGPPGSAGPAVNQPVPPPNSLQLPGFNLPALGPAPSLPTLPAADLSTLIPAPPQLPDITGIITGTGLVGPAGGGSD